jgi:4,5-dihydroxyphthalate decarboxylase
LKLRVAYMMNPRLAPLLDGTVKAEGVDLEFELGLSSHWFYHHLTKNDFDVFEYSISDYLIVRDRPELRHLEWTAIPVFLLKAYPPLLTHVNVHAGIASMRDLKGKRFGLPDFEMTAGLWMRAMVKELYGIQPQDIDWYVGRPRGMGRSLELGLDKNPPTGVSLTWLPEPGAMQRMLQDGEIDAAFPGTDILLSAGSTVKWLFEADGGQGFFQEFYQKTGFLPCNHTIVVQRRILEQEPWVAMALFDAFERSKQESYRRAREAQQAYLIFPGDDFDRQAATFGADPYPSGLAANRRMLAMAGQESFEEGLIKQPPDVDGLFWETVRPT